MKNKWAKTKRNSYIRAIYIQVNNVKVKISQKQLTEFVQSLDLTDIYTLINETYNSIKESASNINYEDIALKAISLIKNITLSSNEFSVSVFGKELFHLHTYPFNFLFLFNLYISK